MPIDTRPRPTACAACLATLPPAPETGGSGYAWAAGPTGDAWDPQALALCYACADGQARLDLARSPPGQPAKVGAYLSADGRLLTTWTGGRLATVCRLTRRGNVWEPGLLAVRAIDPQGRLLVGTARPGMYARLQVAKSAPTADDRRRQALAALERVSVVA